MNNPLPPKKKILKKIEDSRVEVEVSFL